MFHSKGSRILVFNTFQVVEEILDKSWNFIKIHNLTHAFDDIERKGPSKNMDTRIGEHGHVQLHKDFAATNCRNELSQVLAMDEYRSALTVIRDRSSECAP
jgi:hypothetical protein